MKCLREQISISTQEEMVERRNSYMRTSKAQDRVRLETLVVRGGSSIRHLLILVLA